MQSTASIDAFHASRNKSFGTAKSEKMLDGGVALASVRTCG